MLSTSNTLTATSTSPVAIFTLLVRAGRWRTLPVMATTHSLRNDAARSKISFGKSDGSKTVWVRPSRSRMSMKIKPPRSRREWTQPHKVTVCPTCAGRSSLQWCVRFIPAIWWGESPLDPYSFSTEVRARRSLHPPQYCYERRVAPPVRMAALTRRHHSQSERGCWGQLGGISKINLAAMPRLSRADSMFAGADADLLGGRPNSCVRQVLHSASDLSIVALDEINGGEAERLRPLPKQRHDGQPGKAIARGGRKE